MRYSIGTIGVFFLVFLTMVAMPEAQALEAIPKVLTFTEVQGVSNPVTRAVILLNNNPRQRNWATSSNAAWLSVTVSPPNLVPSDRLLVTVDIAGLAPGVYRGMVSIAGMKGDPVSIPVILTVTAHTSTTPALPALSSVTTTLELATNTQPD